MGDIQGEVGDIRNNSGWSLMDKAPTEGKEGRVIID